MIARTEQVSSLSKSNSASAIVFQIFCGHCIKSWSAGEPRLCCLSCDLNYLLAGIYKADYAIAFSCAGTSAACSIELRDCEKDRG